MKIYPLLLLLLVLASGCTEYIVEKEGVYYKDWNEARGSAQRLLEGADPKTFSVLPHEAYGKDKRLVFYQGRRIEGADAASFVTLSALYTKDKYRAYYAGDSIEASRSDGFRIIDSYYATDGHDVFFTTKPLRVCSVKDFRFLDKEKENSGLEQWTTDGCYYYLKHFKIPSEDYAHVTLYRESAGFAKDRYNVYYQNRIINYYEGERILDTVDVATFTVSGYIDSRDTFGCINPYRGRKACD